MPRRLAPWLVLGALVLVSAAAERRLEAAHAVEKSPAPAPAARGEDVADTHQRLDRIYKRLDIDKGKAPDPGGCNGQRDGDDSDKKPKKRRRLRIGGCAAMPAGVAYIIVGVIIAVMIVLIVMSLRSTFRDSTDEEPTEDIDGEAAPQPAPDEPWRVDLSECRRLAEAGNLPAAFAALHRCTLLQLEHERHLVLDQATTNWAYVRQLVSKPDLKRLLADVTVAAERSVLGLAPPDLSHYEKLEDRVRREVLR